MSYPPTGPAGGPPPGGTPYQPGGAPGYSVPGGPSYGEQPPGGMPSPAPYPAESGQQPGYPAQPSYEPGYPSAPGYAPAATGPGDTAIQPAYPGSSMSAPPYGTPMSAPPGSGMSYGTAPAAAPSGGGKGRAVLVLSIVAGLLFVLGGLMTGLFVAKSGELDKTERNLTAQVADRDGRITANDKEIERLKRDLQTANDKIKAIEQDLTGTKNDRDEQERQKQVIAKCLDLFAKAMASTTSAAFEKAIKEADKACTEAEKYL